MTVEELINAEAKHAAKEAKKEGIKEGIKEGSSLINTLNSRLIEDNRLEDLKRASKDIEYQNELLKEYNL